MNRAPIPLFRTLMEIAALWAASDVGFRILLPLFGYSTSYNEAPIPIAAYYAIWTTISIISFWGLFKRLNFERHVWVYVALCLSFGVVIGSILSYIDGLGILNGAAHHPYTDIIFATPWYFFPKALEIFLQQTLIAVLVLTLANHFSSLRSIMLGYATTFVSAHVVLYWLNDAPLFNATILTLGALVSTFVFPPIILRVKSGFFYAYIIHVLFYALIVTLTRAWPPAGYY